MHHPYPIEVLRRAAFHSLLLKERSEAIMDQSVARPPVALGGGEREAALERGDAAIQLEARDRGAAAKLVKREKTVGVITQGLLGLRQGGGKVVGRQVHGDQSRMAPLRVERFDPRGGRAGSGGGLARVPGASGAGGDAARMAKMALCSFVRTAGVGAGAGGDADFRGAGPPACQRVTASALARARASQRA